MELISVKLFFTIFRSKHSYKTQTKTFFGMMLLRTLCDSVQNNWMYDRGNIIGHFKWITLNIKFTHELSNA